ncbi:MAG TPA: 6-phosphogluconolactonase [Stellaceae bacterium]|nr:6-phosphogluconolactonase [Stellaceae bacterium]
MKNPATFEIHADADAVARSAAAAISAAATASLGRFAVCLAGGSTPKRLYELLAASEFRARLPWPRIHWFWGDERFVPRHDPQSNYAMVDAALLSRAPIPPENIHGVPIEGLTPDSSAAAYERTLQSYYGSADLARERPLFDVMLLGFGEDGHTASLFPGAAALDERQRWVVAVTGVKPEPRISLTFPALESSRSVLFLVTGAAKLGALEAMRRGDACPAARVRPTGDVRWLIDRDAAQGRKP